MISSSLNPESRDPAQREVPTLNPRRYVLLDRDGTVIVEKHYLSDPEAVQLLPGAAAGLRRMRAMGVGLILVTNQSGVGRGYFTRETLDAIHLRLGALLHREGIQLDAIYVCPHTPEDHCDCRKPLPGLARRAAAEFGFDPADSVVIGDKPCDIDLGKAVNARTILVSTGHGAKYVADTNADRVVSSLDEAATAIEHLLFRSGVTSR